MVPSTALKEMRQAAFSRADFHYKQNNNIQWLLINCTSPWRETHTSPLSHFLFIRRLRLSGAAKARPPWRRCWWQPGPAHRAAGPKAAHCSFSAHPFYIHIAVFPFCLSFSHTAPFLCQAFKQFFLLLSSAFFNSFVEVKKQVLYKHICMLCTKRWAERKTSWG